MRKLFALRWRDRRVGNLLALNAAKTDLISGTSYRTQNYNPECRKD